MTRRWRRLVSVLAGSGALAFGMAACGDDGTDTASSGAKPEQREAPAAGTAEQAQPVTGGSTTLRLDPNAARVFEVLGVDLEPLGEATREDGRFRFPITGGRVDLDTPSGAIRHGGGLRFRAGGRTLDAQDLVIRPGQNEVTAMVAGERLPLFAVDLDASDVPTSDRVVLPGRAAVLAPDVLPALERRLGVQLPDADVRVGRLDVSAET